MEINRIVLTGGPCAGKTKVLGVLKEHLEKNDYYVITVSETATELITNKILPGTSQEQVLFFQEMILKLQYTKEEIADNYAKKISKEKKVVIIYDRGIMDNLAYLDSQEDFEYLLNKYNFKEIDLLNKYDLVLNLKSVAFSEIDAYENNGIRFESRYEAKIMDEKTAKAWSCHDNFEIFWPTENVEEKINNVINVVDNYLNGDYNKNTKKILINEKFKFDDYEYKELNISEILLDDKTVLVKTGYRDNYTYMIQNRDTNEKNIITEVDAKHILNNHNINNMKDKRILTFIEAGNLYRIVFEDEKVYLEIGKDNSIPINLLPKCEKTFSKKTKM